MSMGTAIKCNQCEFVELVEDDRTYKIPRGWIAIDMNEAVVYRWETEKRYSSKTGLLHLCSFQCAFSVIRYYENLVADTETLNSFNEA